MVWVRIPLYMLIAPIEITIICLLYKNSNFRRLWKNKVQIRSKTVANPVSATNECSPEATVVTEEYLPEATVVTEEYLPEDPVDCGKGGWL